MKRTLLAATAALSIMALAPIAEANAQTVPLRLCTGGTSGKYYAVGNMFKSGLQGKVEVDNRISAGSDNSLRKMEAANNPNGCDAAIVQADALAWYNSTYKGNLLRIERVTTLYPEYAHLICNRESGISKIKDFYGTKGKKIAIGKPGSGTAITWANFVKAEKRYETIEISDIEGTLALNRMRNNDISCILYVAGLGTPTMAKINDENKGELKLVPLNDGDLTNAKDEKGRPVYRWTKIPGGTYKNIQDGTFSTSVDTIAQDAVLIVNADWVEKNDRGYTDLSTLAVRISKALNQE